jgi:tRNA threonylcarbamoyladenosine biosynthesis protein TsaB
LTQKQLTPSQATRNLELSIDSSTRYASVAVSERGECLKERTWRADRNHSVELVPAINGVLSAAEVSSSDLTAIFVARGPGGFSALRVGIATAKSMAMGLNVPLVSIGTLTIEIAPYVPSELPVCAIIAGGGARLYAGWSGADSEEFAVLTVEELADRTVERTVFCGEGAAAAEATLTSRLGDLADVRPTPPPTRRAGTLAALGFARLESGDCDDPDVLEPLYMRSAQYEVAYKAHIQ